MFFVLRFTALAERVNVRVIGEVEDRQAEAQQKVPNSFYDDARPIMNFWNARL